LVAQLLPLKFHLVNVPPNAGKFVVPQLPGGGEYCATVSRAKLHAIFTSITLLVLWTDGGVEGKGRGHFAHLPTQPQRLDLAWKQLRKDGKLAENNVVSKFEDVACAGRR
jgi:hypothetical protein